MRVSLVGPSASLVEEVRACLADSAAGVTLDDAGEVAICCLESAARSALLGAGLLGSVQDDEGELQVLVVRKLPSPYGMRVLMARVDGVVMAERIDTALLPTLRCVTAGQQSYPRRFAAALRRPALTSREKQILGMVVLNASNAEIAKRLWITESAVKNTLTSAFGKLGVRSRAAATELILDPESGLGLGILRITPEEAKLEDGQALEAERR